MTLYRKYRPQTFADFVNQKPIKETVQNQIKLGKITHAYLFTGPRGVGKTTMARLLAKALNCKKRRENQSEPCNNCQSCCEIIKGISLDIEEKDAASNRGIEEIRSLREKVRFAPSQAKYKIFIIDEVHMLTIPAFNALLKTLEEPPENTIFVLATTEPHRLPETIISRCQRFDFKKLPKEEIVQLLQQIIKKEKIKVDPEILNTIAIRSEGCVRDALSILGKIIVLGISQADQEITWEEAGLVIPRSDRQLIERFVGFLEQKNPPAGIDLINHLLAEGIDLEQFCLDLIDFLREKMVAAVFSEPTASSAHFFSQLIDIFIKRYGDLKRVGFLPQLPLELGVLDALELDFSNTLPNSNNKLQLERPTGELNLAVITAKWPEILGKVKDCNHSLPVALSACRPLRVEGDKLILGFKYQLHRQVLLNQKNRDYLENIIYEVCQQKAIVVSESAENLEFSENKDKAAAKTALLNQVEEVFGAEILAD